MDNRDERLLLLLESGAELDELSIVELIGILSQRRLGPDTIGGQQMIYMSSADPRVRYLHERSRLAEIRAFEFIKASCWYEDDLWPDGAVTASSLRRWVDRRMSNFSDPVGDC